MAEEEWVAAARVAVGMVLVGMEEEKAVAAREMAKAAVSTEVSVVAA